MPSPHDVGNSAVASLLFHCLWPRLSNLESLRSSQTIARCGCLCPACSFRSHTDSHQFAIPHPCSIPCPMRRSRCTEPNGKLGSADVFFPICECVLRCHHGIFAL